ncbi:hypothetical protein JOF29_003606 [Kribbella aluminosa]|uniref:Uncharacterized protein n=1 Tax=Kribbella aluminosa TaxID=416017 RepID=A0ABS4ULK0_9ACTN|nr:hypothetical protein [Kribbella aluminosa]
MRREGHQVRADNPPDPNHRLHTASTMPGSRRTVPHVVALRVPVLARELRGQEGQEDSEDVEFLERRRDS